jgi:hypothetical protein
LKLAHLRPSVNAASGARTAQRGDDSKSFSDDVASHTREQISCFGPDGLLRRQSYRVDVLGGATGANYAFDDRDFGGIKVPTSKCSDLDGCQSTGRESAARPLIYQGRHGARLMDGAGAEDG